MFGYTSHLEKITIIVKSYVSCIVKFNLPEENKVLDLKRCTHPCLLRPCLWSPRCGSSPMSPAGGWRVETDAVRTRIHVMEYAPVKKEILPFVTTWMGLEGVVLGEVRQRKTDTI